MFFQDFKQKLYSEIFPIHCFLHTENRNICHGVALQSLLAIYTSTQALHFYCVCWKLIIYMYVLGPFPDPIYSNAVYTSCTCFLKSFQSLSSGVLMIMLVHHSETCTCLSSKTKPLSFMFLRRLLPHIHRLQYWELHWKLERTCTEELSIIINILLLNWSILIQY